MTAHDTQVALIPAPKKRTGPKEPKATEGELLQLLDRRHAKSGNGGSGEFAFLTHVRNDGGFNASRTFDAVAVSLWPSRGYAIDVYEVKVSRSDWLRELKDPAKSEAAWEIGDRFWIVATAGVVDHDELPPGWGLIEAYGGKVTDEGLTGRKLRTVKHAEWHGEPVKKSAKALVPRGLLVAMLRRAGAVPDAQTPDERLISEAEARGRDAERALQQSVVEQYRESAAKARQAVLAFENNSGLRLTQMTEQELREIGTKVRAAFADEHHEQAVRNRLSTLRDNLRRATEQLDSVLGGP